MLLITEYVDEQEMDILCEKTEEGAIKSYKIKGPFLQAEIKNRNGRMYSQNLIEREIGKFNTEKIKTKRAFGELDHPVVPTVNLQNVSHLIENLKMENNNGMGVAKILDTIQGRTVTSILNAGARVGVSSRGVGSLNGSNVNEDYKLITVDIVADPSAPDAFVDGVLEGREFIASGNQYVHKAVEKLEQNLAQHGSKEILSDIQSFINNITF